MRTQWSRMVRNKSYDMTGVQVVSMQNAVLQVVYEMLSYQTDLKSLVREKKSMKGTDPVYHSSIHSDYCLICQKV